MYDNNCGIVKELLLKQIAEVVWYTYCIWFQGTIETGEVTNLSLHSLIFVCYFDQSFFSGNT